MILNSNNKQQIELKFKTIYIRVYTKIIIMIKHSASKKMTKSYLM